MCSVQQNLTFVAEYFKPLVVTVAWVAAIVSKYNSARREGQQEGDGVEIVDGFDLWDKSWGGRLHTNRQFTQHPASHVEVMYQAIVEHTTWEPLSY